MTDILQIQETLFSAMKCCSLFDGFNLTQERQFLMQSEIDFASIWQSPRLIRATPGDPASALIPDPNGKVGAGFYIEMPELQIRTPNGVQRHLVVSIATIEERNLNMTPPAPGSPGGTRTSAEEMAELALDFMFGWCLGLSSALVPEQGAIVPAYDLVGGRNSGLVAYRAKINLRRERRPLPRCDTPVLAEPSPLTFTLTNGANTPNAEIYYMIAGDAGDLRCPCKDNSDASKYSGPIELQLGQVLSWAAWQDGLLPSHIKTVQPQET